MSDQTNFIGISVRDFLSLLVLICFAKSLVAAAELNIQSNRYLLIATSGGLNQQRTGVSHLFVKVTFFQNNCSI